MSLAAFGSFGGDLASSAAQYAFNRRLQKKAHEHQKYMYQHRHQWAVDDLREAGLNPILSAGSPGGGGMPGAVGASVAPSSSGSRAVSAHQARDEIQKDVMRGQAQAGAGTGQAQMSRARVNNQEELIAKERVEQAKIETQKARWSLPAAKAQAEFDASELGQAAAKGRRALSGATGPAVGGAIGTAVGGAYKAHKWMSPKLRSLSPGAKAIERRARQRPKGPKRMGYQSHRR